MFRPMRRHKQQLSQAECLALLQALPRGVLSMMGTEGYPYGIPMNFCYRPEDGCLYFHCAPEGHKTDALRQFPNVSFCCYDEGYREAGDWALNIRSVVVFGQMHLVEDQALRTVMLERFARKYTGDEAYVQMMLRQYLPKAVLYRLEPAQITGKLVNES